MAMLLSCWNVINMWNNFNNFFLYLGLYSTLSFEGRLRRNWVKIENQKSVGKCYQMPPLWHCKSLCTQQCSFTPYSSPFPTPPRHATRDPETSTSVNEHFLFVFYATIAKQFLKNFEWILLVDVLFWRLKWVLYLL